MDGGTSKSGYNRVEEGKINVVFEITNEITLFPLIVWIYSPIANLWIWSL